MSCPNRSRLFVAAVVLGLAISGMHYTAMAGMRLDPLCFDATRFVSAELRSLPKHAGAAGDGDLVRRLGCVSAHAGARGRDSGDDDARRRGALAPVLRLPQYDRTALQPVAIAPMRSGRGRGRPSSVSRRTVARGISLFEDIYAIRANAHYCYVHDGDQRIFL